MAIRILWCGLELHQVIQPLKAVLIRLLLVLEDGVAALDFLVMRFSEMPESPRLV
jgi:hypothetical protein